MMSETQVHTIARQMLEQHGTAAIAQAAQKAQACEKQRRGRGCEGMASYRGRHEGDARSASELIKKACRVLQDRTS